MPTNLPGENKPGIVLPNTTQIGPKPELPAGWFDLARLMIAVNDVLIREGKPAADSLVKWVREHK